MFNFWWDRYALAFRSVVEDLGLGNVATLVFTVVLFAFPLGLKFKREGRSGFAKYWRKEVQTGIELSLGLWVLCLVIYVARGLPSEFRRLDLENNELKAAVSEGVLDQRCWMQNITMPPNLKAVPNARSMTSVVFYCRRDVIAPFMLSVKFNGPALATSPFLFPSGKIISMDNSFDGSGVFAEIRSPSIPAFEMFVLNVYGSGEIAPEAIKIDVTPFDTGTK